MESGDRGGGGGGSVSRGNRGIGGGVGESGARDVEKGSLSNDDGIPEDNA